MRLSSCAATEAAAGLGNRSNPLNGCAFGLAAFAFGGFASGGRRIEGDADGIVGAKRVSDVSICNAVGTCK